MIPQIQSRVGKTGRCFEACIASMLELHEKEVPDFGDASEFMDAVQEFLEPYGLYYVQVEPHSPGLKEVFKIGKVYHTIEGKSQRGGLHACVGESGKIVWDPHPQDGTKHGLVRVDCFGLLCSRMG